MKNFIFYRSRTTIACVLILSVLVSGCVMNGIPKQAASRINTHTICCNNNVLYTDFNQPQYETIVSPFGGVVLGANAIGGAYIGARYPFISTNGGNGVSTPSPVLSGLVTAGIGALLWLVIVGTSFPLGKPQPVPVSDAKWWLQNVADSLVVAGTEVDSDKNILSLTALPKSYIKNYNISGLNHARQYRSTFGKTDYETNLVISSLKQHKFKQTWTLSLGPEDNAIDLIEVFPDNDSIGIAVVRFVTDEVKTVGECKLVADKFPKYAIIAEQRAYDIASKQNTLGELQEFLKLFPNTSLRSKAEKRQIEILYNSYKQDYQACKTADDYTNFIAKHKSKDYDKLIPKAQERVKQLRYKEYKDMFANAKNGYDYAAFINKYASNDPDNLIPRAKAAEYQKLYEEAYSSSDCSRFMEKYANNDPNGYIPQVQEKRAAALVREEQERIAEARRQEEERQIAERFRNTKWEPKVEWDREEDRSKNTSSCDKDIYKKGTIWFYKIGDDGYRSSEWVAVQLEYKYRAYMEGIPLHFCVQEYEISFFHSLKGGTIKGSKTDGRWDSGCYIGNIGDRWPNAFQLGSDEAMQYLVKNYINEVLRKPH